MIQYTVDNIDAVNKYNRYQLSELIATNINYYTKMVSAPTYSKTPHFLVKKSIILDNNRDKITTLQDSIKKILNAGIPVMGHLGLTPQSIYKFGTYTVRAKEKEEAKILLKDAKLLDELGCFGIVLEKIPSEVSKKVTKSVKSPVIGIGAGSHVDGQVLVTHDLVGLSTEFNPRFLRRYIDINKLMSDAIKNYIKDVKNLNFPNKHEQY